MKAQENWLGSSAKTAIWQRCLVVLYLAHGTVELERTRRRKTVPGKMACQAVICGSRGGDLRQPGQTQAPADQLGGGDRLALPKLRDQAGDHPRGIRVPRRAPEGICASSLIRIHSLISVSC